MSTAKKQSRSKAKKSASRAIPVASRSRRKSGAKSSARGVAAKSRPAATVTNAKGRGTNKVAPAKTKTKTKTKAKIAAVRTKPKSGAKPRTITKPKTNAKPKAAAPRASANANGGRKLAPAKPKAAKVRQRRDATGHLDPKYARDLRALSRAGRDDSEDRAFFNQPRSGDDLAEELGEEAVSTMTSGEDQSDHLIGQEVEEERGGPFVKTRGSDEFARGTDRSNPRDATREPFPRT